MKKITLIFSMLAFIALISACKQETPANNTKKITKKIQYDVYIKSPNPDYDWWINNLPGPERQDLVDWIFDLVNSGDYKAYDYFNKELSEEEFKSIGTDTLLMTLMRTEEPYDKYDTTIVETLDKADIVKVRFMESWHYNMDNNTIEKEIIAIAPVKERLTDDGEFIANEPLFWVYFNEDKP
jgi:hypothetical protein